MGRIGIVLNTDHVKGLVLTIIGVLALTPDTLLIRLADADHWTLVFWRGLLMASGLFVVVLWHQRSGTLKAFRRIGRAGMVVALCYGLGSVFFVGAVTYTGVAATLIIIASAPMFAALLGWFVLSESVPVRTVLAIIATFIGIIIVVSGNGQGENNLIGDIMALGTAVTMATAFVFVRHAKSVNMIPATILGGLIAAVAGAGIGPGSVFDLTGEQALWVFLMGAVVLPISFGLITLGPRYIPAPEVGLILLLETVLGPFWVWLVLDETISIQVFVGGAIVIVALTLHSLRALQLSLKQTSI